MSKKTLKTLLRNKTKCTIQHDGWPCGTCFFTLKGMDNSDWQNLLLYRGDYKESELDNLPQDREASLKKIKGACLA